LLYLNPQKRICSAVFFPIFSRESNLAVAPDLLTFLPVERLLQQWSVSYVRCDEALSFSNHMIFFLFVFF